MESVSGFKGMRLAFYLKHCWNILSNAEAENPKDKSSNNINNHNKTDNAPLKDTVELHANADGSTKTTQRHCTDRRESNVQKLRQNKIATVHLCPAHIMRGLSILMKDMHLPDKSRQFLMHVFAKVVETTSTAEASSIYEYFVAVTCATTVAASVKTCVDRLKQLIID